MCVYAFVYIDFFSKGCPLSNDFLIVTPIRSTYIWFQEQVLYYREQKHLGKILILEPGKRKNKMSLKYIVMINKIRKH